MDAAPGETDPRIGFGNKFLRNYSKSKKKLVLKKCLEKFAFHELKKKKKSRKHAVILNGKKKNKAIFVFWKEVK